MDSTGADSVAEENPDPDHIGEPAEDAPFLTLINDFLIKPVQGDDSKAQIRDRRR